MIRLQQKNYINSKAYNVKVWQFSWWPLILETNIEGFLLNRNQTHWKIILSSLEVDRVMLSSKLIHCSRCDSRVGERSSLLRFASTLHTTEQLSYLLHIKLFPQCDEHLFTIVERNDSWFSVFVFTLLWNSID